MIDKKDIDTYWKGTIYDPEIVDEWNKGYRNGFETGVSFVFEHIWHNPNESPNRNIGKDNMGELCLVLLKYNEEPVVARAYRDRLSGKYKFETYDSNCDDIKIEEILRWSYINDLK